MPAQVGGEVRAAGALADDQVAAQARALDLQPAGVALGVRQHSVLGRGLLDRGAGRGDAPADVPERLRGAVEPVDLDVDGQAAGAAADAALSHQNTGART
jgi:hypothetical protein